MSPTNVAFRVDASIRIGTGHVMRCLTLAGTLQAHGMQCHFISREHPGHLIDLVRQSGHAITVLPAALQEPSTADATRAADESSYSDWLGCSWQTDVQQTAAILATLRPDWLVVDHYALDERWEVAAAPHYGKLLVIDDLANRVHRCDLLVDQNLGRQPQDYANLVPAICKVLTGPRYALLRPEFAALRDYSLKRRTNAQLKELLITMGGVDLPNATSQVLAALKACPLSTDCRVTVVMGQHAPWLDEVRRTALTMPFPIEVKVGVRDMAQLMADSDLAIGAAGSTMWERCALGLPTCMLILAENQREAGSAIASTGAAVLIEATPELEAELVKCFNVFSTDVRRLYLMSEQARAICDGLGVDRVVQRLLAEES